MKTIKKVDCKSVGKVYAMFMAMVSFFSAIGISAVNIYHTFATNNITIMSIIITIIFNLLMGILIGLVCALISIIVGYVIGYLFGWFYNRTVNLTGGIKIDM